MENNFEFQNEKDVHSSAEGSVNFEDITSSSSKDGEDNIYFDIFSDKKQYKRKKRGIASWPYKFSDWWNGRKKWQRALMTTALVLFTLFCVFAIIMWLPSGIRGKSLAIAVGLSLLNIGVYVFIHWNKRIFQRVLTIIFAVLLAAVILVTTVLWGPFSNLFYNYDNSFTKDRDALSALPTIDKDITNIALFGIDTRNTKSFEGNSDSIMILSLNAKTHTVKIISVLRDTLVPIKQNGKTSYSKINSAYQRGGPELAVSTINQVFGLDITEYATVNFYGMAEMIEAVGGIEAELTEREVTARGVNNYGINDTIEEICVTLGLDPKDYYIKKAGKQHLNGIQAVGYSRVRYVPNIWGTNNDFGRTDRQRYVMEQLFHKATKLKASEYYGFAKALIPYVKTSLDLDEIVALAQNVLLESPQFKQDRLPKENYQMKQPSGSFGSVVYYDIGFAEKLVHSFIYDDITFDEYVEQNGVSYNDWYAKAVGTSSSKPSGTTNTPKPDTQEPDDTTTPNPDNGDEGTEGEDNPSDTPDEGPEGGEDEGENGDGDTPSEDEPSQEDPDNPTENNPPDDTQGDNQQQNSRKR